MVEVLMESGGQEVAVADTAPRSQTPTECSPKITQISEENVKLTPIQEFYTGQSIFITGGTGFLGKLIIEKLMRSCPNIGTIYMLVRPKKGKDIHQRIEELFDDPIFEKLRELRPKFRHQIIGISGDCSLPALGISQIERAILIREVSIVFHVAATLRFDEKLKLAVAINVQSPMDILNLCKEMPKFKSGIHVSTAYANCHQETIEEKFYDAPIEGKKLISLMECMDEKLINDITPQLLGKWPNTYTFTKAVAENIINTEAVGMPFGIFRPAIVVSTYREPIQGWIDNLYGPTGVAAGAGAGLLRSIHCDGTIQANVVPGDMTINALLASAWDVAERKKENKEDPQIPIYNYVSKDNPITYNDLKEKTELYGLEIPSSRAVWYYSFRNNKYRIVHLFYVYFLHLLPALLVDTAALCVGKPPRLLKVYKKIHKFMDVLNYFTTKQWGFTNHQINALLEKLSTEDQELFFCDIRKVDWDVYFKTYIRGIRIYLIKDPLETLPQARVKWQRMYWMHQALKLLLAYVFIRLSWIAINTVLSIFVEPHH